MDGFGFCFIVCWNVFCNSFRSLCQKILDSLDKQLRQRLIRHPLIPTSYNGTAITYDSIGNPLSYRGYTLGWQGRQLTSLSGNGITAASYKYDASGLRSEKTISGVTTKFEYVGDKLFYEKRGDRDIYYKYNSFGNLSGITYYVGTTGYSYYVLCNVSGDVYEIYTSSGTLAAKYIYDAWGNIISITDANNQNITDPNHVGNINPIRYRGYYFDAETGLYYLQSRYYDSEVGRFINADSQLNPGTGLTGINMFAYCNNNPVNMADPNGHMPFFVITAAIGAVVGAVAGGIIAAKTGKNVWAGIGIGVAGGALLGCGVGAGLGMISGFGAAATASQVGAGLGAIATGTGAAMSSAVVPAAEKAKQVFWAGGQAASKAADTFSKLTQTGSTIANTPAGREIIAKTKDIPWAEAKPMWEVASLRFAQQASGTVNAFIYAPNFSSSSIFMTTELPALLSNPNVNEIVITIFGG